MPRKKKKRLGRPPGSKNKIPADFFGTDDSKATAKRANPLVKPLVRRAYKRRVPKSQKKSVLINIKLTPADKAAIQAMADRFADGNVSKWVLAASLGYDHHVA